MLNFRSLHATAMVLVAGAVITANSFIFGNSHAGPENPQLTEVTRDKRVVWTFKNFEVFGQQSRCRESSALTTR